MLAPKVIPFCRRGKCCPVITVEGKNVKIGGEEEGFTEISLSQFEDLVLSAKEGKFDGLFKLPDVGVDSPNFRYELFDN
jgi:hypothetical protein